MRLGAGRGRKFRAAVLFLLVVCAAFLAGGLFGRKGLFPFPQVIQLIERTEAFVYRQIYDDRAYARWEYGRQYGDLKWVETIYPLAEKTDPASLIRLREASQIKVMRARLYDYIWKRKSLPKDLFPVEVRTGIEDKKYDDIESLARIDSYRIEMEYGLTSIVYNFFPKRPNGKFIIYHQGHRGDFVQGKTFIRALLDKGWSVIAFAMPFLGMNPAPDLDIPGLGTIKNFGHNMFYLLESDSFAPLKFFVEPISAVLNLVERDYGVERVAMTGISGGGWMTILYAALDERVRRSYPVAGKLPIYLLALPPNDKNTNNRADKVVGDYEEFIPAVNQIANFLDLSVLGAAGSARKQVQIINKYDRITYRGLAAKHYENAVSNAVRATGGGSFAVLIDDTHNKHQISPYARAFILKDLENFR